MGTHGSLPGSRWQARTSIPYIMGNDNSPTEHSRLAAAHYPSPALSQGTLETPTQQRNPADASTRAIGAGRCPSRYDWSKHMSEIKHLYIDEDRPLKEVMDIMQKEHNFVAT